MTIFGPVSNSNAEPLGPFGIAWFTAGFCFIAWSFIARYRNTKALHKEIEERGWQWLGEDFPSHCPVRELIGVSGPMRIENAFSGTVRGIDFFYGKCVIGAGKHKTHRALLAARTERDPFTTGFLDISISTRVGDGWTGIYPSVSGNLFKGLDMAQVFALIELIGLDAQSERPKA